MTGCSAVLTEHKPSFEVQATWANDKTINTKINTQWVNEFADSTLTGLVNDALAHNYDLKAAAARVNAARQQAIIDGADRLPQLAVSPNYQRGNLQNAETTGSFNVLFDLSWEIDLWGRIRATQQAAEQEASAVAADLQAARLSLAARTAQSYFDLIEANLQVAVAEQSMKDRCTIADLVRGRFNTRLNRWLGFAFSAD